MIAYQIWAVFGALLSAAGMILGVREMICYRRGVTATVSLSLIMLEHQVVYDSHPHLVYTIRLQDW